jgi:hypothetical protein
VGIANDGLDGGSANDLEVVLWNPANGISDNLTDTIGVNGNSGQNNFYLIDCEGLDDPCEIGDTMRVKIFSYPYSGEANATVTGAGFDAAGNITRNSVPNATLVSPVNFANISSGLINFNCSFVDLDSDIANVSLYGNWSGWHLNETKSAAGVSGSALFTKNLSEGIYEWACFAEDNLSISSYSEDNFTFTVDLTKPVVNSVLVNESFVCGSSDFVRVTCNTNDSFGVERVFIEAAKPNGTVTNYSATFLSGDDYAADISLDLEGVWDFKCISFDYSNNSANMSYNNFEVYPDFPDLFVYPEINFSKEDPFENESIIVSTLIFNNGCSNANNFLVGFYEGEALFGIQVGSNQTISLGGLSNKSVNITWNSKIGSTNLFVFSDVGDSISEFNETNNEFNQTIDVGMWQEFYGNVSGIKILSDNLMNNLSFWGEDLNLSGNIFMTDMESDIDWTNLTAIGFDKFGASSENDFSEIDSFLGTNNFEDSVENVFTVDGEPVLTKDFFIHQNNISGVPIINSTNNSAFFTGILWDVSDDSDGEYGLSDKEDVVFVAELNKNSNGAYGIYDYEIRVPVSLRDYYSDNTEDIYFYYDLV